MVCGTPTTYGPRCERHALEPLEGEARREHDRMRVVVLSEETTCWRCGEPAREDDPLTLDHVVPRAQGGETTRDNCRAAHASCNSSAGATVRGPGREAA